MITKASWLRTTWESANPFHLNKQHQKTRVNPISRRNYRLIKQRSPRTICQNKKSTMIIQIHNYLHTDLAILQRGRNPRCHRCWKHMLEQVRILRKEGDPSHSREAIMLNRPGRMGKRGFWTSFERTWRTRITFRNLKI